MQCAAELAANVVRREDVFGYHNLDEKFIERQDQPTSISIENNSPPPQRRVFSNMVVQLILRLKLLDNQYEIANSLGGMKFEFGRHNCLIRHQTNAKLHSLVTGFNPTRMATVCNPNVLMTGFG